MQEKGKANGCPEQGGGRRSPPAALLRYSTVCQALNLLCGHCNPEVDRGLIHVIPMRPKKI